MGVAGFDNVTGLHCQSPPPHRPLTIVYRAASSGANRPSYAVTFRSPRLTPPLLAWSISPPSAGVNLSRVHPSYATFVARFADEPRAQEFAARRRFILPEVLGRLVDEEIRHHRHNSHQQH